MECHCIHQEFYIYALTNHGRNIYLQFVLTMLLKMPFVIQYLQYTVGHAFPKLAHEATLNRKVHCVRLAKVPTIQKY